MTEQLNIPEDSLREVIEILNEGLKLGTISPQTRKFLKKWIKEEEEYLDRLNEE